MLKDGGERGVSEDESESSWRNKSTMKGYVECQDVCAYQHTSIVITAKTRSILVHWYWRDGRCVYREPTTDPCYCCC